MAFDLKKTYGTNPSLEMEGVKFWLDAEQTAWVKVAAENNPAARDFLRRRGMEDPRYLQIARGYGDPGANLDTLDVLTIEVMAYCIVKDWGMVGKNGEKHPYLLIDGKEVPYSPENAIGALSDPEMSQFRRFVEEASRNTARFRDDCNIDAEGNSKRPSPGTGVMPAIAKGPLD